MSDAGRAVRCHKHTWEHTLYMLIHSHVHILSHTFRHMTSSAFVAWMSLGCKDTHTHKHRVREVKDQGCLQIKMEGVRE